MGRNIRSESDNLMNSLSKWYRTFRECMMQQNVFHSFSHIVSAFSFVH